MSGSLIIQRTGGKKLPNLFKKKLKDIMFVEDGLYREVGSLTEPDKVFLRARWSYLVEAEQKLYGSILEEAKVAKAKVEEVEATQAEAHEEAVNSLAKEIRDNKKKASEDMAALKKQHAKDLKAAQKALKNKDEEESEE